ncbi:MAG: hypothetical protein RL701_6219 [Pseudomonadota bacterium]
MKASCARGLFAAALISAAACSANTDAGTGTGSGAETAEFQVFPAVIYTGSDGTHEYKAPIIAAFAPGKVTWTIADPSVASIAPEGPNGEDLMIKTLKPGQTTITAASGGKTVTATLNVASYTAEQYNIGMSRYTASVDPNNPPCKDCHAPGKGPDHTATELDADPDDEIQHTFVTGVDPEGRPIAENSEFANLLKGKKHMWTVTETEKIGLIAYLRALPPMGFPEFDAPTVDKETSK